jgi:3-deoxy-D-arabino-heptulosonate 7-phosphate (DAHP) synthase class II
VKRIALDKATPGQILAEKLSRHDGVLLANQGAEVSEGLLRMLARQNIDTILIEEEDGRSPDEVLAAHESFLASLEARFVRVDGQPVLMALKNTMIFLAERERDETLAHLNQPEPASDSGGPAQG